MSAHLPPSGVPTMKGFDEPVRVYAVRAEDA
jgi:class 3 adenylate cyclase